MTPNEYQKLAARTIAPDMTKADMEAHALHGMVSEIGELHGIYQKKFQGHAMDETRRKKEVGDLVWFVAEYCTANGWDMEEVLLLNIRKLIARYPNGFETFRSLHREAGDT